MELKRNDMTITGTPAEMAELIRLMTAEPKKVQKKEPTNKKDIDLGKVKALRKAGCTLEKIADEMGCSAQTIANKLKGAE